MEDRIDQLISAFRREPRDTESSEKLEILSELEASNEGRVTAFLLALAADEAQYDLVRIEALKILQLRDIPDPGRRAAADAIADLLRESEDPGVRNYAAMALSNFLDFEGPLSAIAGSILDPSEDPDVRHNAFFAIERFGPTRRSLDLLKKIVDDSELGAGATRVLKKWSGPEFV